MNCPVPQRLRPRPVSTVAMLLALGLQAAAAQTAAPAKPALLAAKAASAPAAAASKPAARAPAKARKATGLTGGDDDLKDLEVERARGKNR